MEEDATQLRVSTVSSTKPECPGAESQKTLSCVRKMKTVYTETTAFPTTTRRPKVIWSKLTHAHLLWLANSTTLVLKPVAGLSLPWQAASKLEITNTVWIKVEKVTDAGLVQESASSISNASNTLVMVNTTAVTQKPGKFSA